MADRQVPLQNVINAALSGVAKDIYTSIPGYVIAFIPGTQRAQVQIGVQRVQIDGVTFDPPPIVDVPVTFCGSNYTVEFQIDRGCEGVILFSQRCIDGWKQTGGVAANPVARFHHPQDAYFIPGIRSLGNTITDFTNDGIRLRDKSGNRHVWMKNDGSTIVKNGTNLVTLGSDNSITLTNGPGNIQILANGNVVINGVVITPTGTITPPSGGGINGANGIPYEVHRHNETGTITQGPRV